MKSGLQRHREAHIGSAERADRRR